MLNHDGIQLLKDDLLATVLHREVVYNQDIFTLRMGKFDMLCLAGLCLRRTGPKLKHGDAKYLPLCLDAGVRQLGLTPMRTIPQIFNSVLMWPADLAVDYKDGSYEGRIKTACRALDRLTINGDIRELDAGPFTDRLDAWREICVN